MQLKTTVLYLVIPLAAPIANPRLKSASVSLKTSGSFAPMSKIVPVCSFFDMYLAVSIIVSVPCVIIYIFDGSFFIRDTKTSLSKCVISKKHLKLHHFWCQEDIQTLWIDRAYSFNFKFRMSSFLYSLCSCNCSKFKCISTDSLRIFFVNCSARSKDFYLVDQQWLIQYVIFYDAVYLIESILSCGSCKTKAYHIKQYMQCIYQSCESALVLWH